MKREKKYYYCTNGDGTTCNGFTPFPNDRDGEMAFAPDWLADPNIECGNALHVVADNPLRCLAFVERNNPRFFEVEPIELMPEKGGKYRCRAVKRIREVQITSDFLKQGTKDKNWCVREAVMLNPNAPLSICRSVDSSW